VTDEQFDKIHDLLLLMFIILSVYCGYGLADRIIRRK
jgi:hypothetical protein